MVHLLPRLFYKLPGDPFHVMLMSDLHIGASDCDKQLIRDDLEWARENKARVFIAGDVFDLILPKDHKRFTPSVLDPALAHTDAVLNAALELGTSILHPYADLIWVIGCGNHETAMTKWHSTDVIALLLERLQDGAKHDIWHGGYTGAIVQPLSRPDGTHGRRFCIWYHHGAGGAAPVSKGLIDFNRLSTWARGADVLWMGHKHNRYAVQVMERWIPRQGKTLEDRPVWQLMTGAYTGGVKPQVDSAGNYQGNWAQEKNMAPQGRGGIKLKFHMDRASRIKCQVML